MLKLYYVPKTRSARARWTLEELGLPYELVRLDPSKGDTKTPEHTKRHPLQHVPVLETDRGVLFESAAIVLYLAELAPEKYLLPAAGTWERAQVYQWLLFAMTELEPPAATIFRERKAAGAQLAAAVEKAQRAVRVIDVTLGSKFYLVGESFTVADLIVGSVLSWLKRLGGLPADATSAAAYVERLEARPAWKRAIAD